MKITLALKNRQRRLEVASRLPPFLRATGSPVILTMQTSFPKDASSLLDIDAWNEECSCTLKGILFLWRLFMALYKFSRFPKGNPSFYDPLSDDDVLLADPNLWVHEAKIKSCSSCLARLTTLIGALKEHFMPPLSLVHWDSNFVRVAIFTDVSNPWITLNLSLIHISEPTRPY